MKKRLKTATLLLAFLFVTSYALGDEGQTILNCHSSVNAHTRSLEIIQATDGSYHYSAEDCTFVAHGCASDLCTTSEGIITMGTAGASIIFSSSDVSILAIRSCVGYRIGFVDRQQQLTLNFNEASCTSNFTAERN